jgi:hypothetical protein
VSERWGFVSFGDVGVVESAFGLDGAPSVVFSGVAVFGHHRPAVAVWLEGWFLAGPPQGGGRGAQGGEQQ